MPTRLNIDEARSAFARGAFATYAEALLYQVRAHRETSMRKLKAELIPPFKRRQPDYEQMFYDDWWSVDDLGTTYDLGRVCKFNSIILYRGNLLGVIVVRNTRSLTKLIRLQDYTCVLRVVQSFRKHGALVLDATESSLRYFSNADLDGLLSLFYSYRPLTSEDLSRLRNGHRLIGDVLWLTNVSTYSVQIHHRLYHKPASRVALFRYLDKALLEHFPLPTDH